MLSKSTNVIHLTSGADHVFAAKDFLIPLYVREGAESLLAFVDRIDGSEYPALTAVDREVADLLLEIGIIEDSDRSDRTEVPRKGDQRGRNLEIHLLMSQGCNFHCTYCYNGNSYDKSSRSQLKFKQAAEFIEWFHTNVGRGESPSSELTIHYFGGEPLLNWRTIIDIEKFLCKLGIDHRPYVTTNLSILPNDFIREIANLGTFVFDVTVDGPREIHNQSRMIGNRRIGSFDIVTKNIERLRQYCQNILLKLVLSRTNQHHIVETLYLHRSLGAQLSSIGLLRSVDSDSNRINLLAEPTVVSDQISLAMRSYFDGQIVFDPAAQIENILRTGNGIEQYCGAGTNHSPLLTNEGKVYSCAWFVGDEEFQTGLVTADGMISFGSAEDKFTKQALIEHNGGCHSCNYRYTCGGPCPASRIGKNLAANPGSFAAERAIKCAVTKPIVNAFLWKWGRDGALLGRGDDSKQIQGLGAATDSAIARSKRLGREHTPRLAFPSRSR